MKEQKKSSWGAVLVSFLKEFLLNSFEAPGHLYYDENLTNEGKRKKNYIWSSFRLFNYFFMNLQSQM